MEELGAAELHVSGQGVREGVASSSVADVLPAPRIVRESSVAGLAARFSGWNPSPARRRTALAAALLHAMDPRAPEEVQEALAHAATVLDIGRSIDFFDRHEHVAQILLATDLSGFSHRLIALTAAVVHNAGDEDAGVKPYAPLLKHDDREAVARTAVLLALADDIEERCPPEAAIELRTVRRRDAFVATVPTLVAWRPRGIAARFQQAFGRGLVVEGGAAG
jgi:exopolyphosphatase/guanosine-5'-triphosphate,3'-diphosphate pyrophosphatase